MTTTAIGMTTSRMVTIAILNKCAVLSMAIVLSISSVANTPTQEMKLPQTAGQHREIAEEYQKKAATYRKEAEAHRGMLSQYTKTVAQNPKDSGENSYIRKMRLHCEKFIKAAESLALEAEEMAKYHLARAKELEGR